MFKFFQKIRRKLLVKGNLKKYALYATGEILLIVVGILLALQINNWNEYRKERKLEKKLLKELSNDLEVTLFEIETDLETHRKRQKSEPIVQSFLAQKDAHVDSLAFHLWICSGDSQVYPKTSGYDLLQSKGMDIISNDTLRQQITNLYQLLFTRLVEIGRQNEQFNIQNLIYPHLKRHFKLTRFSNLPLQWKERNWVIFSYEALTNDQAFLFDLQHSFDWRRDKINRHVFTLEAGRKVLFSIKKELKKME